MSKTVLPFSEITDDNNTGGKARSLSFLAGNGVKVPPGSVILGTAYDKYVDETGLKGRILIELTRKRFDDMRWEELWDASQRIRHMFNTTDLPDALNHQITDDLKEYSDRETAVRSSGVSEDSGETSFAGLHESFVNVRGIDEILEKIRLVWASLWSDSALLYRQELGLSVEESSMPVVVQEMIYGDASGVVFTSSPGKPGEIMIEAVHGLCKGLVDGLIEPDRWTLDKESLEILTHYEPDRVNAVRSFITGTVVKPLDAGSRFRSPLIEQQLNSLSQLALRIEKLFGVPQDIEWTIRNGEFYIIQARPITTFSEEGDVRSWYLSLRRSIESLAELENRISNQIIPDMNTESHRLGRVDLSMLGDDELIETINLRSDRLKFWYKVYWDEFIPMAHGARLFGQIYNDRVKPSDPHEFTGLLSGLDMLSTARNTRLTDIARILKDNPRLAEELESDEMSIEAVDLLNEVKDLLGVKKLVPSESVPFLIELAKGRDKLQKNDTKELIKNYLDTFPENEKELADEALRIGRRSWKLRDDDNIVLRKFEKLLSDATEEAKNRLLNIGIQPVEDLLDDEVVLSLSLGRMIKSDKPMKGKMDSSVRPRQLVGQPAGPGLVTAKARIIDEGSFFDFKEGEILVCDAIDPNMTFIVPLASGIIERRGGMLIHGAIIAREYGIPCVTGIPDASSVISTGDQVTVDGYLGIVTINR